MRGFRKLCVAYAPPSTTPRPPRPRQSEVANRILGVYLRCLAGDRPRSWLRWLPWAKFCYNSSYQTALKATPFQVVYGREPPPVLPYQSGAARVVTLDRQLRDCDAFLADIRERLLQAQDHMKQRHDMSHRALEFEVGDWAWLRLHQLQASGITDKAHLKLVPWYFGPFQVEAKIGSISYRLRLPPNARIHNVFHVVFLKKHEGPTPESIVPLPQIVRGRAVPTPESIVRARLN
uniref:Tf2-1-like SH3-like domain-containing protein n=1 Tax=Arundo donax TaxID=35708 RepID=A0A0A9E1Z5_ARUDO